MYIWYTIQNVVFWHLKKYWISLACFALYAGKEWPEKICEVRKKMSEKKAVGLVVTALDEIAWLLNLRGSDISYNPVFFAYVIVTTDSVMFVCYTLCFVIMKWCILCFDTIGWYHEVHIISFCTLWQSPNVLLWLFWSEVISVDMLGVRVHIEISVECHRKAYNASCTMFILLLPLAFKLCIWYLTTINIYNTLWLLMQFCNLFLFF